MTTEHDIGHSEDGILLTIHGQGDDLEGLQLHLPGFTTWDFIEAVRLSDAGELDAPLVRRLLAAAEKAAVPGEGCWSAGDDAQLLAEANAYRGGEG